MRQSAATLTGFFAFILFGSSVFMPMPISQALAQSQGQMNHTAKQDYSIADRQMNVAYRKLMATLAPAQKSQLKTAQFAWLKFRDAEGVFLASKVKGGSVYPLVFLTHMQEITQARTRELEQAYKLFTTEGNM